MFLADHSTVFPLKLFFLAVGSCFSLVRQWLIPHCLSLRSPSSEVPFLAAEPQAPPVHLIQPVGRPIQCYVYTSGSLQWQEPSDHQIPVLCPKGKSSIPCTSPACGCITPSYEVLQVYKNDIFLCFTYKQERSLFTSKRGTQYLIFKMWLSAIK